ncbi:uncharacterized protein F5891DRAFT_984543 [Suillus fuscotomentosus]|uniref:Uncharacterized protein n=1 Tax=Suillus fuscotomentosus TaxID=1912939 RepID=A0AAD4HFW8_9AGAM|nr:uncharacterized protein F5891DRAFT_984543 [Suillus fuscotomentosus]KAG1895093.1 hypothetical protein F5891DRAFT_984543 [Suillus fuscotomentosus]
MVRKSVRFATTVYSDDGDSDTSPTSYSSYVSSSDSHRSTYSTSPEVTNDKFKGPLAWWSGYTLLDSWIPPKLSQIPRFKGLIGVEPYIRFKRYDMCFLGEFDEVTSMLVDIHVLDMVHGRANATTACPQSPRSKNLDGSPLGHIPEGGDTTDVGSMHEHAGPDGYPMDVEMPGVQEDSNSFRWQDSSEKEGPSMVEEDAYDCGWEDPMEDQLTASVTTLGHQEDPYDCGWEAQPDDGAVIATSAPTPKHREDPYDCGWGDQPEDCVVPTTVISSVVPEDPYNCGWEDQMNANNAAPLADPDDPYDCGWDSPTLMCWQSPIGFKSPSRSPTSKSNPRNRSTSIVRPDVIDLTSAAGLPPSKRGLRGNPMRIERPDVIDLTSAAASCSPSSREVSQQNTFEEAGWSMNRAIQRLNSIGTDQHK